MSPTSNVPSCNRQDATGRLGLRLAFLTMVVAVLVATDVGYSAWGRIALSHAVREGAHFATAGPSFGDASRMESIRQIVRSNSSGILDQSSDSQIVVSYTTDDSGITFVHVNARASRQTPLAAVLGSAYPIDVSALCNAVVERSGTTASDNAAPQLRASRPMAGSLGI